MLQIVKLFDNYNSPFYENDKYFLFVSLNIFTLYEILNFAYFD